jgi:hypothetical protein
MGHQQSVTANMRSSDGYDVHGLASSPTASPTRITITIGCLKVLGPVIRNAVLRLANRHASCFDLIRQVILYTILYFETALVEHYSCRPAFWPDISHPIRPAQF